jgi:hypothetical protein
LAKGPEIRLEPGSEKVDLLREKSPNCGLKWRENVGMEVFVGEKEKLAEKTRGELCGEPKRPRPDLREREKGVDAVVVGLGLGE